jgi:hypothetical protein
MNELIEKYGKQLIPLALGVVALYDRFIVMEMEMDSIKKDFTKEKTIIEKRLDRKIKIIDKHEERIRVLECLLK